MCSEKIVPSQCELLCTGHLDAANLQRHFHQSTSGGILEGNHWKSVGRHLVGQLCSWRIGADGTILDLELGELPPRLSSISAKAINEIKTRVTKILPSATHPLAGRKLLRLLSDRDIQPEVEDATLVLNANGNGATNIIRRLLLSTSDEFPRELVQKGDPPALLGRPSQFDSSGSPMKTPKREPPSITLRRNHETGEQFKSHPLGV